jgi:hypothetical protein
MAKTTRIAWFAIAVGLALLAATMGGPAAAGR